MIKIQNFILPPKSVSSSLFSWFNSRKSLMDLSPPLQAASQETIIIPKSLPIQKESILARTLFVQDLYKKKNVKSNLDFSKILTMSSEQKVLNYYITFVVKYNEKGGAYLEAHHIVPRHLKSLAFDLSSVTAKQAEKALDHKSNISILSPQNHMDAHALLFIAVGCQGDYSCVRLRNTEASEIVYERRVQNGERTGSLNSKIQKEQGTGFFDPAWQSEKGVGAQRRDKTAFFNTEHQKKMAIKGGSANTQAQIEARSKNGKLFVERFGAKYAKENAPHAKKMGLQNQSELVKHRLTQRIRWNYKDTETFISNPAESVAGVIDQLNSFVENPITAPSSFYKMFKGKQKRASGWSIMEVLDN